GEDSKEDGAWQVRDSRPCRAPIDHTALLSKASRMAKNAGFGLLSASNARGRSGGLCCATCCPGGGPGGTTSAWPGGGGGCISGCADGCAWPGCPGCCPGRNPGRGPCRLPASHVCASVTPQVSTALTAASLIMRSRYSRYVWATAASISAG